MATNDIPVIGKFKRQVQQVTPTNGDATIMDDTVMTMDGLALMGGQTSILPTMPQTIVTIRPRGIIKKRR